MATITVTSTADSGAGSLRQAIADANDGDVILFDADVFPAGETTSILLSSYISINKSVSIYGGESDGEGGYTSGAVKRFYVYRDIDDVKTKVYFDDDTHAQEGETILFENVCRVALDGQETHRCLYSNFNGNFIVSGVAFLNGVEATTGTSGGACAIRGTSSGLFIDCAFDGCSAATGGAIEINSNGIILDGCNFATCIAHTTTGGGVYSSSTSKNTLNNCVFDGCSATNGGGLHSSSTSQNTLNECVIRGCSANNDGGGVHLISASQATLNNCNITSCSANNGAGLCASNTSRVTLNNSIITLCEAQRNSGGCWLVATSSAVLNNSTITNNKSGFQSLADVATNDSSTLTIIGNVTTIGELYFYKSSNTLTIADGAALSVTKGVKVKNGMTITSAGRGYLALAPGLDASAATITNVVLCSYGAGLETFKINADGASWTAQDLTTPILIETRNSLGGWESLTTQASGGAYAEAFAIGTTARAFDGVRFFVASIDGYWRVLSSVAVVNGGGSVGSSDALWFVSNSTITPNIREI